MSISISITALVKQIKGIMKDNLSSSNLLGNIRQIRQNCQTKIRSLINLFCLQFMIVLTEGRSSINPIDKHYLYKLLRCIHVLLQFTNSKLNSLKIDLCICLYGCRTSFLSLYRLSSHFLVLDTVNKNRSTRFLNYIYIYITKNKITFFFSVNLSMNLYEVWPWDLQVNVEHMQEQSLSLIQIHDLLLGYQ